VLFFRDVGFNVWDTMIYEKMCPFPANVRYNQNFEFMFILSKGKVKTFNPLKEPKTEKEIKKILSGGTSYKSKSYRNKDGTLTKSGSDDRILNRLEKSSKNTEKTMGNIWKINAGYNVGTKDTIAFKHPATFPDELAERHIFSWSNQDDVILDPFMGSGTTAKMAFINKRNFIGIDISEEYIKDIAKPRLKQYGWSE